MGHNCVLRNLAPFNAHNYPPVYYFKLCTAWGWYSILNREIFLKGVRIRLSPLKASFSNLTRNSG
jgi:hypothetical protein